MYEAQVRACLSTVQDLRQLGNCLSPEVWKMSQEIVNVLYYQNNEIGGQV